MKKKKSHPSLDLFCFIYCVQKFWTIDGSFKWNRLPVTLCWKVRTSMAKLIFSGKWENLHAICCFWIQLKPLDLFLLAWLGLRIEVRLYLSIGHLVISIFKKLQIDIFISFLQFVFTLEGRQEARILETNNRVESI